MADELAVVIKTKLEIDEQQLRKDIDNLSGGNNAIKVPVEADKDTFNKSLSELQRNPSPISIKPDTDSIIKTIQDKLSSAKFSIKVNTNALAKDISDAAETASKKASAKGADWKNIFGSEKYVAKLVEKSKQFEKSFADGTAKIADTQITYKPLEKMYQAAVKYEDSIGRTTTMVFSLNEGMEEIQVTQLKLTDNEKKYRAELERTEKTRQVQLEKTLDYLNKQESLYKDLSSKAFDQKNKLTDDSGVLDDYGVVAQLSLNDYKKKIDEIRAAGTAMTAEQKRELESLAATAKRTIVEQQSAKWGATDFASKDVSKQIELEKKKIDNEIEKYAKSAFKGTEQVQALDFLSFEVDFIDSIDGLNKWRENLKLAHQDIERLKMSTQGDALKLSLDIDENQVSQIEHLLDNKTIATSTRTGITQLRKELDDLLLDYKAFSGILSEDGASMSDDTFAYYAQKVEELDKRLASAANTAKLFNGSLSSNNALEKADMQIEKLKNDLESMEVNWSKALEIPELKADINEMRAALENADAVNLPNLQKAFTELRSKIKAAGADCKSFGDRMVDAFKKLKDYFSVAEVFQYIKEGVSEVAQAVKEVDTAMTELRKVTNLSESGYDQFTKEAAGRAKEIGTTYTDMILSTSDFSRLGYEIADAENLASVANIYYRVGDNISSIDEASQSIISTMKAFNIEADNAMSIVDLYNKVGEFVAHARGDTVSGRLLYRLTAA